MTRLTRGLGALLALVLGLVGVPVALVALGGNPLPGEVGWSALRRALFTPDDGTILVGLITVVGWLAWLVFTVSVVSELAALASHRRIRIRLPGLGGPQRFAAGLLIAVIALVASPQVAQAPAAVATAAPTAEPVAPAAIPRAAPVRSAPVVQPAAARVGGQELSPSAAAPSGTQVLHHTVRVGDDLWSLAEHYYGEGRDWRKIAIANPDVLSGGPDRLTPGWRLRIPDLDGPAAEGEDQTVTVRRGDTLSTIAERELGAADQWRAIYRLNRAQLGDPDELATGMRLVLPGSPPAQTSQVDETPTARKQPRPDERADTGPDRNRAEPGVPPTAPPTAPPTGQASAPTTGQATSPTAGQTAGSTKEPTTKAASPTTRSAQPGSGAEPNQTSAPSTGTGAGAAAAAAETDGIVAPLVGVGGLLAAGLLAGLAARRRVQLQLRPVGRRIPQPPPRAQAVEVALGRAQRPLSLRTLDRATRAIAAHCRTARAPLPPLLFVRLGDEELELVLASSCPEAPVGFTVRGRSWVLSQADAGYLGSMPGLSDAGRPWPALVTLGRDDHDRQVLGDLEALGLLQLSARESGGGPVTPEGVLAAMAVELSFSPWADELILTLVGDSDRLPEALGKHNVSRTDDIDALLSRLERRAEAQRQQQPGSVLGQHRIDPDLADPWAPEIVLVNASMTSSQRSRLDAVITSKPRVTLAAVVVGDGTAPWSYELPGPGEAQGTLAPAGFRLAPQSLEPPTADAVLELVECTGSELTTPAPWWTDAPQQPDPPPDNVTFLGRRFGGWGTEEGPDTITATGEGANVQLDNGRSVHHPTLQLLGPVELLGAAGDSPPRASKQCLEYCAWLLEHPGTTAQAMANALVVAEGTRRSNMSRLRGWLGSDDTGQAYLPDAYTGRILLHPSVSSDWQRLQILTAAGVHRAGSDSLRAALDLVRGAPLADAAPGQWHWAEELRTDMISCLRDIGVELTSRALDAGDVDQARWAAARALVAAPGDELLLAARIRTEHLAGNGAETERLTLQLAAQARTLGMDLDPETVTLLQQVMEGRVRARMA